MIVNKFNTPGQTLDSIKSQIFKTVYDQWNNEQSVVVGKNKLLCEVNVLDFTVEEQAPSIKNLIVMSIKANIEIKQDPGYAEDLKKEQKYEAIKEKRKELSI